MIIPKHLLHFHIDNNQVIEQSSDKHKMSLVRSLRKDIEEAREFEQARNMLEQARTSRYVKGSRTNIEEANELEKAREMTESSRAVNRLRQMCQVSVP